MMYKYIGYITRWRSLWDLHTEGIRPRGCVNHMRLTPSDKTNLYRGQVLIKVLFIFQLKACKKLVGVYLETCIGV